ncbi:MAG: hypothetical protein NTZ44_03575 [Candidatus Nomurabacteria bacterium]|nr:hypothetical protein [Candidatus Nomurabacteria bacterium]
MTKNLIQDMVKQKKVVIKKEKIDFSSINNDMPIKDESIGKNNRSKLWIVAIISIIFLIFAISFLFSRADITINPTEKDFNLDSSFSATKESTNDSLSFNMVILSGEESKILTANGIQDTLVNAKGKVVIYNTMPKDQPLLIDTRLEGSNGKMYKTDKATIVPSVLKDGTPGQVEVGIYATEAGVEYNSTPLDFKIFGFKSSPKYTKIYGRSNGDISGGFKGQTPIVSDTDKTSASSDLKTNLQTKLFKQATDQLPDGFMIFKDGILLNTEPETLVTSDNGATLSLKGTLYGFVFKKENLANKITKNLIPDFDDSSIYIPNINDLTFSLTSNDGTSYGDAENITFTLTGKPKIVWMVDTENLLQNLAGSNKVDFNNILSKYPNITSADLSLKPAWKSSFPEKIKDIHINTNYPK